MAGELGGKAVHSLFDYKDGIPHVLLSLSVSAPKRNETLSALFDLFHIPTPLPSKPAPIFNIMTSSDRIYIRSYDPKAVTKPPYGRVCRVPDCNKTLDTWVTAAGIRLYSPYWCCDRKFDMLWLMGDL